MGFMKVEVGKNILGLEGEVAWATPGAFTVHNRPCAENGDDCMVDMPSGRITQLYKDPSHDVAVVRQRAASYKSTVASDKRLRAL